MLNLTSPRLLEVGSIGSTTEGYISVAEVQKGIPFDVKRVYWTYYTPQNVIRGYHAHKELFQVIFAVCGSLTFYTENREGERQEFVLNEPHKGLFIPPLVWREIKFSHNAVLLCLASEVYSESDYIRDYDNFKSTVTKLQTIEANEN